MKKSARKKSPSSPLKSKKTKKDEQLDEALIETFPASDATAKYQGLTGDKKE